MRQKDIRDKIVEKADEIAQLLWNGKDVELRKSKYSGISVAEISKKVILR